MPLQQSMLLIIITILTRMLVVVVHGQGYLCSPSSRQTFAAVRGVRSVEDAAAGLLPLQEQCVFCHVSTPLYQQNVCGGLAPRPDDGTETKRNYHDAYMVADGSSVVPFTSQGTYAEGGTLVIESILRTNRRGHIEVSVCNMDDNDDGTAPTQDCFNANPLLFDQDLLYGAPIHNEYPHRAYIPPSGKLKHLNQQTHDAHPCFLSHTIHARFGQSVVAVQSLWQCGGSWFEIAASFSVASRCYRTGLVAMAMDYQCGLSQSWIRYVSLAGRMGIAGW